MDLRATTAVPSAIEHTRRLLFDGSSSGTWLTIAFAAWLATLGTGGTRFRVPGASGAPMGVPAVDETWSAVWPWVALAFGVLVLVGLFAIGLWVAIVFLNTRGAFLLLDNVVTGRAAIVRPWNRHAALADDLFLFRLKLGFAFLGLVGLPLLSGFGSIALWSWLQPDATLLVPVAVAVTLVCAFVVLSFTAVYHLALTVVYDIVVPVMFVRRCTVSSALRFFANVACEVPRAVLSYALLRVGLGLAVGTIGLLVSALFCCVQWIPFVDTVLLLPLIVFMRAFSLHFVAGLDPDLARLGSVRGC